MRLILSIRSYDWIDYTAGLILSESDIYHVMILLKDDDGSMCDCKNFCSQAIYEQRKFDLFNVGKKLGVKKLINLGYDADEIDINKLTSQLQLYLMLSGVNEVYCQYSLPILEILKNICNKLNIKLYFYNIEDRKDEYLMVVGKEIRLSNDIINIKNNLSNLTIGRYTIVVNNETKERFYYIYKELNNGTNKCNNN